MRASHAHPALSARQIPRAKNFFVRALQTVCGGLFGE